MLEPLVKVLCDTSFLIHLATNKIKNIQDLDTEIGEIQFIVPSIVKEELEKLSSDTKKKQSVTITKDYIKNLEIISISGNYADESLINFVKKNGGIVATVDQALKENIKKLGGSIMSFSNNRIVLES